jgi:hypothetical protein
MFKYRKSSNVGNVPEILQVDATASEAFVVGEALTITSGKVTKASGTTAPKYISAEKKTAVSGDKLSVYLVEKNQEYETDLTAAGTLVVGTKVTISSDGLGVTATTTSGVATVVEAEGATVGSKVLVRFE